MNEIDILKILNKGCVVDLSNTLIKPVYLEKTDDLKAEKIQNKQKFYCQCGHLSDLNVTIKRHLILNEDLDENEESVSTICCQKCKKTYSKDNPILFLTPNIDFNFSNEYKFIINEFSSKKELILKKLKNYIFYDSKEEKIFLKQKTDFVKFNPLNKKIYLYTETANLDDDKVNFFDKISEEEKEKLNNSFLSCKEIGSGKVQDFDSFFKFISYVDYYGFENIISFLQELRKNVNDSDKLDDILIIKHFFENSQTLEVVNENSFYGIVDKKSYFNLSKKTFGINKVIRKKLNVGDFFNSASIISKIYSTTLSFPNITTIFLTKGFDFFYSLLTSESICLPFVYNFLKSTNPISILEVTSNLDNKGNKNFLTTDKVNILENSSVEKALSHFVFKISPTIFNSFKNIENTFKAAEAIKNNIISKHDLEFILQKYDSKIIYDILGVCKNNIERKLSTKQLIHIIDNKLHISKNGETSAENLTIYFDTINTINLLNFNQNLLLNVKSFDSMKELHDDLSAKYSAFRDAKKGELYLKSVQKFINLNDEIDDISFNIIPNLEELNKEGQTMSHCVYTYLERICDRKYLAIHVQDTISNERATMGCTLVKEKVTFEQLKGYQNSRASANMINALHKYMKKHNIYNNLTHNYDLNPDKNLEKRMKDYLTEEEVEKIKNKKNPKKVVKKNKKFLFF
jgi:hypothetical protein